MAHAGLAEDLGAMIVGVRQIVHQGGVLGAVVAAAATVSAQGAGHLRHAERVDLVFEVHADRRPVKGLLHHLGRTLKRLELAQRRKCDRVGLRIEHAAGEFDMRFEDIGIVAEFLRPLAWLVGDEARVHLQRHIGIDQRGAAKTATD